VRHSEAQIKLDGIAKEKVTAVQREWNNIQILAFAHSFIDCGNFSRLLTKNKDVFNSDTMTFCLWSYKQTFLWGS